MTKVSLIALQTLPAQKGKPGHEDRKSIARGATFTAPAAEARGLIRNGQAEAAKTEKAAEKAAGK